jgi:hypothetical protein
VGNPFLSYNYSTCLFEEKKCFIKKKRDHSINIIFNFHNPFID